MPWWRAGGGSWPVRSGDTAGDALAAAAASAVLGFQEQLLLLPPAAVVFLVTLSHSLVTCELAGDPSLTRVTLIEAAPVSPLPPP
jgi:hypothetical protein